MVRRSNFSLDSVILGSLTLRDYSKVCVRRKMSFSASASSREILEVFMPSSTMLRATRILLALFCLMGSTVTLAQSTDGRVLVLVAEPTGAVLGNVTVRLI